MTLDTKALALAGGVTTALAFTLCAVAVALAPGATTAFFSYVLHLDLSDLARPLTWGSYCVGVFTIGLGTAALLGFFGWFHNFLVLGWRAAPWRTRPAQQHG